MTANDDDNSDDDEGKVEDVVVDEIGRAHV